MKTLIAAAAAVAFMGTMSLAQAGVPTARQPTVQPHSSTALAVPSNGSQNAPTIPGATAAQGAALGSDTMVAIVGGLLVAGAVVVASLHGGHAPVGAPGAGSTGTTGTTAAH